MRRRRPQRLIGSILLFVMLQVAWFCLVGIWIYWFVATNISFTEISERVYPQINFDFRNVFALVGGLVLLVGVAGGITVMFGKLRRQVKVTRMYDSFIANVTHELKSPLASMQIHLETLLSRELTPEASRSFVELVLADTARLEKHINSILHITGLEERRSTLELQELDADALFRRLFRQSVKRFRIEEPHARIVGEARCIIRGDERTLEIIMDNLVDNAVKYSVGPPDISMILSCGVRNMTVSVTDQGVGIPQSEQRLVFRKFVRLDNSDSPSVRGTGLGLYWVREIVRHHKGRISVSSEGRGHGSTFTIELPTVRRGGRKSSSGAGSGTEERTT